MKQLMKTLPIPISGLMLGTTALANLIRPYNIMKLSDGSWELSLYLFLL